MKKTIFIISAFAVLLGSISFQSCKNEKDDDTTPTPTTPNEFIADNSSFGGFESWTLKDTKMGTDPAGLGNAHGGADSTSVRKIYFKGTPTRSDNGQFPVGTLISKNTTWNGGSMITAMAKRGNNFDASGNNWEYFVLNPDGTIVVDNGTTMRGANIMNGMCKSCHAKVSGNDYIFTN